ncbi:hypothetical protein LCGC14_1271070 [marine sediment metagenome]|uniref:Uncharacterized protein n=1 Tax=marine sediment metagenome TaxID=412755 RepID=A0A0F9KY49_9ZZZZ
MRMDRMLPYALLWEQEVPGSNPGAPTCNSLRHPDLPLRSFSGQPSACPFACPFGEVAEPAPWKTPFGVQYGRSARVERTNFSNRTKPWALLRQPPFAIIVGIHDVIPWRRYPLPVPGLPAAPVEPQADPGPLRRLLLHLASRYSRRVSTVSCSSNGSMCSYTISIVCRSR